MESERNRQIQEVPLAKREEMVSTILATINIPGISRPSKFEMTSTMVVEGLRFKWRAYKTAQVRGINFMMNGRDSQERTNWWPHASYVPEDANKKLKARYDAYLEKYFSNPVTMGAFSIAVIRACAQKEQEGRTIS